jgi:hypothetical protein
MECARYGHRRSWAHYRYQIVSPRLVKTAVALTITRYLSRFFLRPFPAGLAQSNLMVGHRIGSASRERLKALENLPVAAGSQRLIDRCGWIISDCSELSFTPANRYGSRAGASLNWRILTTRVSMKFALVNWEAPSCGVHVCRTGERLMLSYRICNRARSARGGRGAAPNKLSMVMIRGIARPICCRCVRLSRSGPCPYCLSREDTR